VGIDRLPEDRTGPAAADGRGTAPPDLPVIPNEQSRLPRDHPDSTDGERRATATSEYRATVDAVYREAAVERGCDRVREVEQTVVTPAMRRIETEDPDRHLAGFENRLKGRERLTEKVTKQLAAQPDLTPDEAFAGVKDAIRYTFVYGDDRYTAGAYADCERLRAEGFASVDLRNTWEYEEYKGINSWWREPTSGLLFEVQFHTQASYDAKQLTHAAYERIRDPMTPDDEVERLRAFQREVSADVSTPPGVRDIFRLFLGGRDADEDHVLRHDQRIQQQGAPRRRAPAY
jgi:hypothetical protein